LGFASGASQDSTTGFAFLVPQHFEMIVFQTEARTRVVVKQGHRKKVAQAQLCSTRKEFTRWIHRKLPCTHPTKMFEKPNSNISLFIWHFLKIIYRLAHKRRRKA
jgi:hypothetical protein